jgi:peptidoglycan/xylan/chitin deacetylase (PgdA/CDA1 family)
MTRRSAILTYHSLDDSGSVISTRPDVFRRQMEFLAASGVPVRPLPEVLDTPGAVAITFDDGFRNLLDNAIPVLEKHRFPATIFVVGAHCGGRNDWPTQPVGAVPDLPLLDWSDLAHLPDRISLGAHTMTHPHLGTLSPMECERELRECRDEIEQRLGRRANTLAYPYGTSTPTVREIAARHFDLAVGTSLDFLPAEPKPMDLPRIDTFYLTGGFRLEHLFTPAGGLYVGLRRHLRRLRNH